MLNRINLLNDILISVDGPFTGRSESDSDCYGAITESDQKCEYFKHFGSLLKYKKYK